MKVEGSAEFHQPVHSRDSALCRRPTMLSLLRVVFPPDPLRIGNKDAVHVGRPGIVFDGQRLSLPEGVS